MIRFLTDEHLPNALVDGLVGRGVDVVRVRDVGLGSTADPAILDWAARHHRVFVSLDRNTVVGYALDRVGRGEPMAGVVILRESAPPGLVLDELHVAADCGIETDFRDQVVYIPFPPRG